MVGAPRTASSPGRVTILGEHTDYNLGVSLGVATGRRTTARVTLDDSGVLEVCSEALGVARCELARPFGPPFLRLAAALARAAGVAGATIDVASELPVGEGLSSSASYGVALALALGVSGDELAVAVACRDAEQAAGSDVGLLDQLVVLHARDGHVVDVDFAGPLVTTFELSGQIGLTVVDTGVRRLIAGSPYGARRAECALAESVVGPLGLATLDDLAAVPPGAPRKRARHVVTECARVRAARCALATGDLGAVGRLLDEAHESLRDDFEASTSEVERVRGAARSLAGVVGVRLVGAGFGGSLLVAHDPRVEVRLPGRRCEPLVPGPGAALSATR